MRVSCANRVRQRDDVPYYCLTRVNAHCMSVIRVVTGEANPIVFPIVDAVLSYQVHNGPLKISVVLLSSQAEESVRSDLDSNSFANGNSVATIAVNFTLIRSVSPHGRQPQTEVALTFV